VLLEKKDVCAYKEQYPGASQQNILNYFFYGVKPSINRRHVGYILSEKKKWENKSCEN
jgi:hypothetical protein